jgi:L-ascorbate metabolism protein UlaG (beta-lactamase superfamily)
MQMAANLGNIELTFCGQAAFAIKTPGGKHVIIDPFLVANPLCPEGLKHPAKVDTILVTHAHGDHFADVVPLAKKFEPHVVCIVETGDWLQSKGIKNVIAMNKGGTTQVGDIKVTMTHAVHSNGLRDGDLMVYGGEPAGYVIHFDNGFKIYHAGDTCVFSDMKLIGEIYKPDLALLPIGDFYTMGPLEAAHAIRLLGVGTVIPMHYKTFPVLTGTPAELREQTRDIAGLQIIDLNPGETLTGSLKRLAAV